MSPRLILSPILAGALALTLLSAGALASAQSGPQAAAAAKCAFHGLQQEHLGPSYVTSLEVSGVSCATGRRLVRAYYSCRLHSGGTRGHCGRVVLGFHCSEARSGIKIQFDATVTCTSGSKRVVHTYTQNT